MNSSETVVFIANGFNMTFNNLAEFMSRFELINFNFKFLFVLVPTAFFGLLLNLLSLIVLSNKSFDFSFYFYIRVTVLCSIFINISHILLGLSVGFANLDFNQSILPKQWFNSKTYSSIHNTLTFYRFIMDFLVILERIAKIKPKFEVVFTPSPLLNSFLLLIIASLVNVPYYFIFETKRYYLMLKNSHLVTFYIEDTTEFAKSTLGKVLNMLSFFVKHVLTTILELVLNVASIIIFKNYNKQRQEQFNFQTMSSVYHLASIFAPNRVNQSVQTKMAKKRLQAEQKLYTMVIFLSIISIIQQTFLALINLCVLFTKLHVNDAFAIAFISTVRHSLNFFIFVLFNRIFRQKCKILICEQTSKRRINTIASSFLKL
jgi:hypothetical protein